MGALLREASGPFVLYESLTLDEVAADPLGSLVPPERVIPIPTVVLDGRRGDGFSRRPARAARRAAGGEARVRARFGARARRRRRNGRRVARTA